MATAVPAGCSTTPQVLEKKQYLSCLVIRLLAGLGGQIQKGSRVVRRHLARIEDAHLLQLVGHVKAQASAHYLLTDDRRALAEREQLLDDPDFHAGRRVRPRCLKRAAR